MEQIDTKGMNVAKLSDEQLQSLMDAETTINKSANHEVYLLAVQRY
ncbi:MAG: hypothetical protein K9L17_10455 [Clostridiales bacterium]|nr:hypothetical protein [Clostridiales bacterium]MCF8023100.1 hypothetical protein [Clostridiales bacterium]